MNRFHQLLVLTICAFLTLATGSLWAQSTGALVVTTSDASGAAVPGAKLTLKNDSTGEVRSGTSGPDGTQIFDLLAPGRYNLTAEMTGFAAVSVTEIGIRVDTRHRQAITFSVADVTERVDVSANTAQVVTDTAALGEVLQSKKIADLPLNGRAFLQLATLSAGVVPPTWQNNQSTAQGFSTIRPPLVVSVSGVREISTDYLFDGIPSRHQFYGAVGLQPPVDSIAEFKVQRGYFSPQFGQPSVVNVVMKSGSNTVHGALWEFLRNDKLDARSFFDAQKAPWRMNQFGFNAGGPVIQNKLFWFGGYEGLRTRRYTTSYARVPTDAQFAGDFSGEAQIFDPMTWDPATRTRQPFAGNIIPNDRISSFATRYRRFYPAANSAPIAARGLSNLVGQVRELLDDNKFDVKADYVISEKNTLMGRFSFQNSANGIGSLFPYRGLDSPLNARNAVLGWTHVFSPTVVNDLRLGFDRALQAQGAPLKDAGEEQDWPSYLGLQNLNQIAECNAPPNVNPQGYSGAGVGNGNCIIPANNNYTIIDNLSMTRGRHTITLGGSITKVFYKNIAALAPLGSFTFTGQFSGNSVADFLLGAPFVANGSKPAAPGYILGWLGNLYINDDFKVSRNLTVNVGLRWQISPPMVEKFDKLGVFDPTTGLIRIANQNGESRSLLTTHYRDFAPRFGIAYTPGPNWVVRTSYGIYFDRPPGNDLSWNNIKWPFQTGASLISDPNIPTVSIEGLFPSSSPGQLPPRGTSLFNYSDRSGDPYLQQWTLSIQRSLPMNFLAEVAYVGSKGTRLSKRVDSNLAPAPPAPGDTRPLQDRRPYPQWSFILDDKGFGVSTYHGLQSTLRKELSHGLSLLTAYTWARSMDTDSFDSKASRNYRPGDRDYTRSIWDLRHRFTLAATYDVPWLKGAKGFAATAFGGWQISSILTFQTGLPFSVQEPGDPSNTGVAVSFGRPNRICDGNLPPGERRPEKWIDTGCFAQPAQNTYGNAGMHYLDTDGTKNVDLALLKDFRVTENHRLQFRTEFFNSLNNVNFNQPGAARGTPSFGQITGSQRGRNIQFALKYLF